MPRDEKLENWIRRFEALHPNNKKHIKHAIQISNILFTSEEQIEDFLSFCEKADIMFQLGIAE